MGRGGQQTTTAAAADAASFTWSEVRKHQTKDDRWLVIDNHVYNITNWVRKHPGGSKVISHYAGQDASEPFVAFHNDQQSVRKFLKPLRIGRVTPDVQQSSESTPADDDDVAAAMRRDLVSLRGDARRQGLFKPSAFFYVTNIGHLILLEVLAYCVMRYVGIGWIPWTISFILNGTVQAQAGWTQHDYGHQSVFKKFSTNKMMHRFVMCFMKGASSNWWNHLHNQHHAKPNVLGKDPDVRIDSVFVVGETMAKKAALNDMPMPYNWQHRYFFAIGPPLLFPVYFQYMVFRHAITRRDWADVTIMLMFYVRMFLLYGPLLGIGGTIKYLLLVRCFESHWFVWVSQSNHLPMHIDDDEDLPWLRLQLKATCDIEKTVFNDWFTGHLNFQIEHHLFPTMPRHNLYKIQPRVQALCEKYDIKYVVKPLWTSFTDIVKSLKSSGQIWQHYYEAYHLQ